MPVLRSSSAVWAGADEADEDLPAARGRGRVVASGLALALVALLVALVLWRA